MVLFSQSQAQFYYTGVLGKQEKKNNNNGLGGFFSLSIIIDNFIDNVFAIDKLSIMFLTRLFTQ